MARKSVWDKDYAPYGRYTTGPKGNTNQWKNAFDYVMNDDQATIILQDDSPLAILGLNIGATINDIKAAFHKLVMIHHPDKGGDENVFKKIVAAYHTLTK